MGLEDTNVIRTWLETNFKQALAEGDQAVVEFRAQVTAMGPEVENVLRGIEGTTATVSAPVGESLETTGVKIAKVAGEGEAEAGKAGFAKLAGNVLKAERVMSGLAGGTGFARMGPMLESITGAMGMAGGVGKAGGGLIMAFEVLIPKVEALMEKMTGLEEAAKKATAALKAQEEQAQKTKDAVDKMLGKPTEEQETTAKEITALMSGEKGKEILAGIEQSLRGTGAADVSQAQWDEIRKKLPLSPMGFYEEGPMNAALEEQKRRNAMQAAGNIFEALPTSPETQDMVRRMPGVPAEFRTRLAQQTPEARAEAKRQSDAALVISAEAEATYKRREAAQKETAGIDMEMNAAFRDKMGKHFDKQLESTMRSDEEFNKKLERDPIRTEHVAETAKRQAEAKAARDARENTPEAQLRRAEQADRAAIIRQARAVDQANQQAGGEGVSPEFLQNIVSRAVRNRNLGATIAQAVNMALDQHDAEIARQFATTMAPNNARTFQFRGGN